MGKLVKFCSSCDEGFAERFAFCPTCGATLQAFEMQPVEKTVEFAEPFPAMVDTVPSVEPEHFESAFAASDIVDEPIVGETFEALHIDEIEIEEPVDEEDEVPVTIAVPATAAVFAAPAAMYADEPRAMQVTPEALDSGYYITVIDEKNASQRNWLLLGSAVFCVLVALSATVYSIFDKDLGVGAIDDGNLFAAVIVDEPMTVEEEIKKEKEDKSGGGGGGGRDEKDPTSQGDLADQSPKPTRPPDVNVPRFQAELVTPPPQTEGVRKFPKDFNRWGDPNSKFTGLSNGTGTGGGQGSGVGTGQGSGRGTGTGSGTGSGSGSGNGDGDGDGDGSGRGGGPPPPSAVKAVTTPLQIIAKPKAMYTDAARTNAVSGTVSLKVVFLASGSVGGITPVTRLPHGLTEQAIAAARQIKFKPKQINGVAQSISMTVVYSFNIY